MESESKFSLILEADENEKPEEEQMVEPVPSRDNLDNFKLLKQINADKFKEKILQDIRYAVDLSNARDILQEKRLYVPTAKAAKIRRIYHQTAWLRTAAMVVYLALPLFERPNWCLRQDGWNFDCTLRYGVVEAYNSQVPKISNGLYIFLSLFTCTFLTILKWVKLKYIKNNRDNFPREYFLTILTVLLYVFIISEVIWSLPFPMSSLIRPIYFALYFRTMRKTFKLYLGIVWRSRYLLLMLFVNFMLFGCSARIFFYRTAQNQMTPTHAYFEDFWDTLYNLLVCQTTCNYPDIMYPIFAEYRFSFLFFMLFIISNYFLLYNMIIAIFYFNFKEILNSDVNDLVLKKKYHLLDILNEMIAMHRNENGTFEKELISKGIVYQKEDIEALEQQIKKKQDREKAVQREVNEATGGKLNFIYSPIYESLITLASFIAFMVLIWQTSMASSEPSQPTDPQADFICSIIEAVFTAICFVDACIMLYAMGWKNAKKSAFVLFELVSSMLGLVVLLLFITNAVTIDVYWVHYAVLPRCVRVIRYIGKKDEFWIIIDTFYKLIPFFRNLAGLLFIVFYTFTVIGTTLYGGKFNSDRAKTVNWEDLGITPDYIYENFNDFGQGLITCFHLLVVNNWLNTVALTVEIQGSRADRFFFVGFYIAGVLISYNIMIAFIIDMFVSQLGEKQEEINEQHRKEKEVSFEAKIKQDELLSHKVQPLGMDSKILVNPSDSQSYQVDDSKPNTVTELKKLLLDDNDTKNRIES